MGLEPISLAAFDFESNVYTIPPLQRCGKSVPEKRKVINRGEKANVVECRQEHIATFGGTTARFLRIYGISRRFNILGRSRKNCS